MAQQAVHEIDPHEHVAQIDRGSIVGILSRPHRNRVSHRPVGLSHDPRVAGPRDHFLSHHVIRFVLCNGVSQVNIESIASLDSPRDVLAVDVVLEKIAEKQRPLVGEFGAPYERVDHVVALERIGIGQEIGDVGGRRNTSGQVQCHAAQELFVGCKRSRLDVAGSHAREDFVVDEIPARY